MVSNSNYIGESVNRSDAPGKVTGDAKYIVDVQRPDALVSAVKRSPYPHAKVVDIDTSKAEALDGVEAVLTPDDVPNTKYAAFDMPPDQSVLNHKLRFVGDPVVAVAATDKETAEEALQYVDVEYDRLPNTFDPEESLAENAPTIHDHDGFPRNVAGETSYEKGDVESALESADEVVHSTYTTSRQSHVTPETYGLVADYKHRRGKLELLTAIDKPFFFRTELAGLLEMDPKNIRIRFPEASPGGFGKENFLMPQLDPLAALLSKEAHKPVILELDREEDFFGTITRHPCTIELKTGVTDDGEIIARQAKALADTGGYVNMGGFLINSMRDRFVDMYPHVENVAFEGKTVYTNNPIAGSARGIGTTQIHYAMESHMDEVARALETDPVELRRAYHIRPGDDRNSGGVIENDGLTQCIDQGMEAANWPDGKVSAESEAGKLKGFGMAIGNHYSVAPADQGTSVTIKVNSDGSIDVLTSTPDSGHGSQALATQVAGDVLNVDPMTVGVTVPDTATTPPESYGATGSRSAYILTHTVHRAAENVREKLLDRAAEALDVTVEELELSDGRIFVANEPETGVDFADLVSVGLTGDYSFENPTQRPTFAADFAEVSVDKSTGWVDVERIVCAQDVGYAVNPAECEGQIEGGVEFAMEFFLDELNIEGGRSTNTSMVNYKALVASEMPDDIVPVLVESSKEEGPFGAKGLGTGVMTAIAPSIANAIYDATGKRVYDLPLRFEDLLFHVEGEEADAAVADGGSERAEGDIDGSGGGGNE